LIAYNCAQKPAIKQAAGTVNLAGYLAVLNVLDAVNSRGYKFSCAQKRIQY
jgi:hypothetical protein